jgi:dTDP-4-amino-4,6-dideoxygalactose transaminase
MTNDIELGNKAKHLTTTAKVPHPYEYVHDEIGYNYRMPNINAALGCAQMENLDFILKNKRETAEEYKSFFKHFSEINFLEEPDYCFSNYWLNTLVLKDHQSQIDFLQFTNNNGIMTRPLWTLMNKLPMFKDCQTDELINTLWFEHRVVNIPSGVRIDQLF